MFIALTVAIWATCCSQQIGPVAMAPTKPTAAKVADTLIGAVLVNQPSGRPVAEIPESQFVAVSASIVAYATQNELLDAREANYYFVRREDFAADLDVVRRRREDFTDSPRVSDVAGFPSREAILPLLQINRDFLRHVERLAEWELDRTDFYRGVARETEQLYRVWDSARDASCEFYYVTVRRSALQRLKTYLGDEAYSGRRMPPYLPVWRFREMR